MYGGQVDPGIAIYQGTKGFLSSVRFENICMGTLY